MSDDILAFSNRIVLMSKQIDTLEDMLNDVIIRLEQIEKVMD